MWAYEVTLRRTPLQTPNESEATIVWAFEKKPYPLRQQTTVPRQAQQTVPDSAGNQAMLAMLGIQNQAGDTRFSEALRARFAPKPMPQAERSQSMPLSPEVLQKAEERYQTPLTGLKAYEDTGLLDSGYNGYAQGNEIHIDGSLTQAKREEVLMHEVGHVVQRGSGKAQGSGLLDNPVLEQQADQGFAAPQSFAMPTSAAGPVMGDFNADMAHFRNWKADLRGNPQNQHNLPAGYYPQHPLDHATPQQRVTYWNRQFYDQQNRAYESVENGQVGSIYYGAGNQIVNGQPALLPPRANGAPRARLNQNVAVGGNFPDLASRLRLIHQHGPQVSNIRQTERYVLDVNGHRVPIDPNNLANTQNHRILERFYNNGRRRRHRSRGFAQRDQAVGNLLPKDHEKLLRAVMFAQHIAVQNRRQNPVDEANQFLYAYMKSHPRLADIPLNMGNAQGRWRFQPNANYRTQLGSWITRQWKRIRGK